MIGALKWIHFFGGPPRRLDCGSLYPHPCEAHALDSDTIPDVHSPWSCYYPSHRRMDAPIPWARIFSLQVLEHHLNSLETLVANAYRQYHRTRRISARNRFDAKSKQQVADPLLTEAVQYHLEDPTVEPLNCGSYTLRPDYEHPKGDLVFGS